MSQGLRSLIKIYDLRSWQIRSQKYMDAKMYASSVMDTVIYFSKCTLPTR